MIIAEGGGHTLTGAGSGTCGILNESKGVRVIHNLVTSKMNKLGNTVINCTIEKASSQAEYLRLAVAKANAQAVEYALHIHMNASKDKKGHGVECWVYPNSPKASTMADKICSNISNDLNLYNRGVKENNAYAWLRNTNAQAIIVECLFCDNQDDVNKYNPEKIAEGIVRALTGQTVTTNKVYKNVILYKGEADKTIATVMSWGLEDCIIKDVDSHIPWEANNVFVVGTPACIKMDTLVSKQGNEKERFTKIEGKDRWETLNKALNKIGK